MNKISAMHFFSIKQLYKILSKKKTINVMHFFRWTLQ